MGRTYDLVVIGTGAGAGVVARKCRAAGRSVAIVDERPYGGTCALRGCDPKKVLIGAVEVIDAAQRMRDKGVEGAVRIAWPALMRHKVTFTEPVPEHREREFHDLGITTLHGHARFVGPNSLQIAGETIEARKIHIATGARPMPLGIDGKQHLATSDDFLELPALPESVVFVGSGFISFELAHVAARAGGRVTMLEMTDRPLAGFDPDLVDILAERTRALGVDLRLETRMLAIEERDGRFTVKTSAGDFDTHLVVHAAGRMPNVAGLALDAANVAHDKRGIVVNEFMQSVSNPAVYAAGDAAHGGLPLTPVASFEAHVAAANLLEGNHKKVEYPPIPSVVFTLPPLATSVSGKRRLARKAFASRRSSSARAIGTRRGASEKLFRPTRSSSKKAAAAFSACTCSARTPTSSSTCSPWRCTRA